MTARYTGRLERAADGTITGYLMDEWQWRITLFATRDPAGGYTLSGVLGEPPEALGISLPDRAEGGA